MFSLFYLVVISIFIGYFFSLIYSLFHYLYFQFPGVVITDDSLAHDSFHEKDFSTILQLQDGDRLVKKRFSLSLYINEKRRYLGKLVFKQSIRYWMKFSSGIVAFTVLALVLMKMAI